MNTSPHATSAQPAQPGRPGTAALGVIAAALLTLLAGCGSNDDTANDPAALASTGTSSTTPAACDTSTLQSGGLTYAKDPSTLHSATLCVDAISTSNPASNKTTAITLTSSQLSQLANASGPGKPLCNPAANDVALIGKDAGGKPTEVVIASCGAASLVACSKKPCPVLPIWKPPAEAAKLIIDAARRAS